MAIATINTSPVDSIEPNSNYYERDGMYTRLPIIHIALLIERKAKWAVEVILAEHPEFLGLIHWDFNKRIQFLTSLKALTEPEKGKFTLFQQIRNKLVHDMEANSLVNCFKVMGKNPDDVIFNLYPQDKGKDIPLEDRLFNAVQLLIDDIADLLMKIEDYVLKDIDKNARASQFLKGYETTISALSEVVERYQEELMRRVASTNEITSLEIARIPAEVFIRGNAEAQKKVRAAIKDRYNVDVASFEKASRDVTLPPSSKS